MLTIPWPKALFIFLIVCLRFSNIKAQDSAFETATFHQAHLHLTDVIVTDILSPPVASRVYMYAHVAAYEALV
ncbi:MAG: phosphatidic acid phosphatase, partial [Runella zeae]